MNNTKERPIVLTAQEVKAVLAGDKTQHRVPVDIDHSISLTYHSLEAGGASPERIDALPFECLLGNVGDRLWVQEDWRVGAWREIGSVLAIDYKASPEITNTPWVQVSDDEDGKKFEAVWIAVTDELDSKGVKPNDDGHYHWPAGQAPLDWRDASIMERWASRLLLEITDIRIERIKDISEADAKAMGLKPDYCDHKYQTCEDIGCIGKWASTLFLHLRHEKKLAVHYTDWVWVVGFKAVEPSEVQGG